MKFFRTAALVNQLSEAKVSGSLNKFMRQIRILKIGRTFYRDYKDIEAQSHEEFLLKLLERELASEKPPVKRDFEHVQVLMV